MWRFASRISEKQQMRDFDQVACHLRFDFDWVFKWEVQWSLCFIFQLDIDLFWSKLYDNLPVFSKWLREHRRAGCQDAFLSIDTYTGRILNGSYASPEESSGRFGLRSSKDPVFPRVADSALLCIWYRTTSTQRFRSGHNQNHCTVLIKMCGEILHKSKPDEYQWYGGLQMREVLQDGRLLYELTNFEEMLWAPGLWLNKSQMNISWKMLVFESVGKYSSVRLAWEKHRDEASATWTECISRFAFEIACTCHSEEQLIDSRCHTFACLWLKQDFFRDL